MKEIEKILKILRGDMTVLREKYKVKTLGVFGSYVRGEQKRSSDLDILVEFQEPVGLFKFMELEEFLENNTHVIVIEVSDIYKDKGNIDLKLPLVYDNGYKAMSTMDDRNLDSIPGKTFAFEHLIDGVREAYENSNDNFIHISIPVKK